MALALEDLLRLISLAKPLFGGRRRFQPLAGFGGRRGQPVGFGGQALDLDLVRRAGQQVSQFAAANRG